MEVGNEINSKRSDWDFGGNVPENFVKHAQISIPFYLEGHKLISTYSDYFVKNNSICYELGVSTGELIVKLSERNKQRKNVKWIGIDSEIKMVEFAKNYTKNYKNIEIVFKDCLNYDFKNSDLIVSYYCIQFIQPSIRQLLINKVFNSLNWGGAFFFFEKVRAPDARFQDISVSWYNEWKESNGFSPNEIFNKTKSLKGILEPFSTQGNLDLLYRAGFKDVMSIMKCSCFEGFLAIK